MSGSELTLAFFQHLYSEDIYRVRDAGINEKLADSNVVAEQEKLYAQRESLISQPAAVEELPGNNGIESLSPETVPESVDDKSGIMSRQIDFIGGYHRKIIVLVREMDEVLNNGSEKSFFSQVLTAIKMNFNDIAVINLEKQRGLDLDTVISELCPEVVIGFAPGKEFVKDCQECLPFFYNETIVVFYSNTLKEISKNTELKRLLWNHLKTIFKL